MEKRTPHCPLERVWTLLELGKFGTTREASRSAAVMGFSSREMIAVARRLSHRDFYKSMTTYDNHRVWQDVYRPWTPFGRVYLKLMVIDELLIVSFKEL